MGKYKIEIKKSAAKELAAIPNKDLKKIIEKIQSLSVDSRSPGCIKLSDKERYRIRVGHYRILYSIDEDILVVNVVKIGRRKNIYR